MVLALLEVWWGSTRLPGARAAGTCQGFLAVLFLAGVVMGLLLKADVDKEIDSALEFKIKRYTDAHARGVYAPESGTSSPVAGSNESGPAGEGDHFEKSANRE